jgi:hypothetical protein
MPTLKGCTYTRLEMIARFKRSSFLGPFVSYEEKSFVNTTTVVRLL